MFEKDKLLILGASGHGKVVADIAMKMKKWADIAFLDDNDQLMSTRGRNVIGRFEDADQHIDHYDMFVALGDNAARKRILTGLIAKGASIPTLIHPSVILGADVEVKIGTVIMPGVIINTCSSIGAGCIVNTGTSVDHDNVIGDYVHLSPGVHLAGTVYICEGTWIGIGGIVSNNISIRGGSTSTPVVIGAGAVVVRDIVEPGTFVGMPARRIK